MKKATIQLETLTCPSCSGKIEGAMKSLTGVDTDSIRVLFNASKVKLEYDETEITLEDIEKAIENVGFQVLSTRAR